MTPFTYNLGVKAPTPNRKDARFVPHAACCAVNDSRPSCRHMRAKSSA